MKEKKLYGNKTSVYDHIANGLFGELGDCVVAEVGNVGKADDQLLGGCCMFVVAPLLIEEKPEALEAVVVVVVVFELLNKESSAFVFE
mgnify:CR=1 FL=1